MHIIETRNLTHIYRGAVTALSGVDFIAGRKERVAVIGANGAGKSTLFQHFNGILTPTSGEVLVHGLPVVRENLREIRSRVGLVFQNPDDQIFSPTVEQDIAFGPQNLGLDEGTIAHRVEESLRLCGIEDLRERVPHHLSGGEKKRVAIAGVIAMEPQVLVLDEPTAGLDPRGVTDIMGFVTSLPERFGMTIIISTHHVELVPEVADYIYVMDRGRVVAEGSVEEIFVQQEMLSRLGLDIPTIPKLLRSLQEAGVDVEMAYTYEEARSALIEACRKRF